MTIASRKDEAHARVKALSRIVDSNGKRDIQLLRARLRAHTSQQKGANA